MKVFIIILFSVVMCRITCAECAEQVFVDTYYYNNAIELVLGQEVTISLGEFGQWRQGFDGVSAITIQTQQRLYFFDNLPQPFLIGISGNPYDIISINCVPEPASVLLFVVGMLLLRVKKAIL